MDLENNAIGRKYKDNATVKTRPNGLVIVIKEGVSPEILTFYDLDKNEVLSKCDFVASVKLG